MQPKKEEETKLAWVKVKIQRKMHNNGNLEQQFNVLYIHYMFIFIYLYPIDNKKIKKLYS